MSKVFIVDDCPVARLGLKSVISNENDLELCGETASIGEALQIVGSVKPDVAIVDLSLEHGRNKLALIQQLSREVKILVCSFHNEKVFTQRVMAAGVRGYIHKCEAVEEIVRALYQIIDGDTYLSPRISASMLGNRLPEDRLGSSILELTNREMEVFELLGHGYETGEIAEQLQLSPKTIGNHYQNIVSKLGLKNKAKLLYHAVLWVREEKYS